MPSSPLLSSLFIRIGSVALAAVLACLLAPPQMLLAMVVFGQGHFLLAYLYQFEGGHLGPRRLIVLAAVLALVWWVGCHIPLEVFGFLTGLGFLIHFSIDEARLLNGAHSLFTSLEAIPFIAIYGAIIAQAYLGITVMPFAMLIAILAVVVYGVLCRQYRRKPNATTYAFIGWTLLSLVLYLCVDQVFSIPAIVWFWGLVIVHYAIWYAVYWYKLQHRHEIRTRYVWRVVLLNVGLMLAAYVWLAGRAPFLALIFAPLAFNVWTFMHGLASLRKQEVREFARLP